MKIIRNLFFVVGFCIFAALCITEVASYFLPSFGVFGVIVWVMSFGLLAIYSIYQYGKIMLGLVRPRRTGSSPITAIILTSILLLVLTQVPVLRNVNFETTQQISCSLNKLLNKAEIGAGFRSSCFLGYPNRQYIIPALPSVIFGREIWSLNLGGALYIAVGLICFAAGLLKHFSRDKDEHGRDASQRADFIVGLTLAFILHLYYFNHMALWFEQSIFPFTFGLMFVGLWLSFRHKKEMGYVPLIGFTLAYLVFSYTPSLAFYGFAVMLLLYAIQQKIYTKKTKLLIFMVITYSLVAFTLSLGFRTDIRFTKDPRLTNVPDTKEVIMLSDLTATTQKLVFREFQVNNMSPFLHPFVIFLLIAGVFGIYGWKYAAASIWAIITIYFSMYAHGFADPAPEFALHRALIVYPILLLMLAQLAYRYLEKDPHAKKKITYAMYIGLLFIYGTGLLYHRSYVEARARYEAPYINTKEAVRHTTIIMWLRDTVRVAQDQPVTVMFDGSLREPFLSLPDRMSYFLPHVTSKIHETMCEDIQNAGGVMYYLVPSKPAPGLSVCPKQPNWHFIKNFTFEDEGTIQLYQVL